MGILTEDMKRTVREQRLAYVASVCPDGTPNLSPKATTTVWDDDHLVYLDIRSPQTRENVLANPPVEVNVVDPVARKGYRFKGVATVLTDGPLFDDVLALYPGRRQEYGPEAVVLIRVERARPLISPAHNSGRTEQGVLAGLFASNED